MMRSRFYLLSFLFLACISYTFGQCTISDVILNGPGTICESNFGDLAATVNPVGNYKYEWYYNGDSLTTTSNPTVPVNLGGTYEVKVIELADELCFSVSNTNFLIVEPMPDVAIITPASDPCVDNIALTGSVPSSGTGTWSTTSGLVSPSTGSSTTLSGMTTGLATTVTYTINTGTACPSSTDNITLTSKGVVVPTISIDSPLSGTVYCLDGDEVTFTALPTGQGSSPTYEWYVGGNLRRTTSVPSYTELGKAILIFKDITVTLTSSDPCAVAQTTSPPITLMFRNPSNPSIVEGDTSLCEGEVYRLTAVGSRGLYTWLQNGVPVATGRTYDISSPSQSGVYTVQEETICGLSSPSNDQEVTVNVTPGGQNGCLDVSSVLENAENKISIHPQPFSANFTLEVAQEELNYTICNQKGVNLEAGSLNIGNSNVLGKNLPSGLYTLKVYGENYYEVRKVIKL